MILNRSLLPNHVRSVQPYPFTFRNYIRKEWINLSTAEIYQKYFPYILFNQANVKVNGNAVAQDYIPKAHEIIEYEMINRTEPDVPNWYEIIFQNEDLLVVHKPAPMPVHPCGRYFKNSLSKILENDGYGYMYSVHRIDLSTEGLVIFARNVEVSKTLSQEFALNRVTKKYYAKVMGKFFDKVECTMPIRKSVGVLSECHPDGKFSHTIFKLFSYNENENTSIVECTPITGRTHQIRLHLAYLGFAIIDDQLYNLNMQKSYQPLVEQPICLISAEIKILNYQFSIKSKPQWLC